MALQWAGMVMGLTLGLTLIPEAHGQIDPEKRRLIQLGYNQSIEGRSPISGYGFFYLNEPNFPYTNTVLRMAVAPVYLDSELGIKDALGSDTDLGVGFAGGGYADSYSEIRRGKFWREESFTGHGADLSASVYHLFNPDALIPLYGIARGGIHQTFYERDKETASAFELPGDLTSFHFRSGLRWGGQEPLVFPKAALELSGWYEGQYRLQPERYGFFEDREIQECTHSFWVRSLIAYTLPEWHHNFGLSMTAGASVNTDRLSASRLGGVLPLGSEFPLSIPGYYYQELSTHRFLLWNAYYNLPLDRRECWGVTFYGATALVDYLAGMDQPGHWHSGVGGGLSYQPPSRTWLVVAGYGYGFDAIRSDGRGANMVGLFCQFDLEAHAALTPPSTSPRVRSHMLRSLDWLMGR